MIKVTTLRAKAPALVINADLIETVEATPDTVITLTTGHKYLVQETPDQVISLVIAYRRALNRPAPTSEIAE
ncbi:MAG: flagellar FlbD family protein [Mycobacterium leprae]